MSLRPSLAFTAGLAALLIVPAAAQAANTYADEDRPDNTGNCLTPATACKTLTGVGGAIDKAGTGDTVFIDGGTYAEGTVVVPKTGQSLIYEEFGPADAPAVIDGGTTTGVGIGNYDVGTIQGLTIRGNISAVQSFGSVTLIGNTFDEGTPPTVFTTGIVHLEGNAAEEFEVIGNTFTDPSSTDGQFGIQGRLGSTSMATIRNNSFNGFWRAIDIAGNPPSSYSTATHVIDDNTFTGMHQIPDPDLSDGDDGPIPGIALFVEGGSIDVTDNLARSPGVGFTFGYSIFSGAAVTSARNEAYGLDYGFDFNLTSTLSMNGDVAAGNSLYGITTSDDPTDIGSGDLDARNVTAWGNGTDITGNAVELTLDSSIVEDPIGGGATCTINFSRGPTTSGNACETFQTTAAPGFVDPTIGIDNFHLAPGSPMIDMGSTVPPVPGTLDLDGGPRAVAGTCGGTARRDIGADEFVPNCTPPPPPPGDKDPPETTIVKKPGKKIPGSKTTVKFTSDEPGSSFQCALDKKPFSPCTSPRRLRGLDRGKHKFQVRAVDLAGNVDPSPVGVKFKVAG